ncbi:PTS transporter subunit EIIA [Rahnella sp. SAP-1]|jgi:PTS system ascorbate-specific IIA component|uniref:PTS transporter subunit EIIA n=1 Tax=Rouxiella aceris TaxID=2703884 RepID=A0A848MSY6_9GAMM|nr:PTS sugar transporter subunit IIA [Rouxiella aceris]NMP29922.1 PTS transporter subunit EIIA [Rouxiella aceris]
MLSEWLDETNVKIINRVTDWQQAVAISLQPMFDNNIVELRYLPAILSNCQQFGPYFVLGEGIAMPHARPEQGVLKKGLSLLIIRQGVAFNSPENDPVYLVFSLAATDGHSHIAMIAALSALFSQDQDITRLKQVATIDQALSIIGQY